MFGCWFLGDDGATPRTVPRLRWASRELWFSPNQVTSLLNSWIYIEWETLIWRISDSPSASSAPLKGVLASSPNAPSH